MLKASSKASGGCFPESLGELDGTENMICPQPLKTSLAEQRTENGQKSEPKRQAKQVSAHAWREHFGPFTVEETNAKALRTTVAVRRFKA